MMWLPNLELVITIDWNTYRMQSNKGSSGFVGPMSAQIVPTSEDSSTHTSGRRAD